MACMFSPLTTYLYNHVEEIQQLLNRHPYLTYLVYGGIEYIGIIQNSDDQITTIYDFGSLRDPEQKKRYLDFGEQWWWESHRMIPINVFLKSDWSEFKFCVKTMNSKEVDIKMGPLLSLKEMASRRSKRRSITLIRKVN